MRHYNAGGQVGNGPSVDLTRMRNNRVNRANKDDSLRNELPACIYGEHNKMFLPMTRNVIQKRQNIDSSKQLLDLCSPHMIIDFKSM